MDPYSVCTALSCRAKGLPAGLTNGFAAGTSVPSRFTVPLITVAAFFGLGFAALPTAAQHR